VISAQKDPQVWYMGSAVDQSLMEDGVVFARVRERALSGDHKRLAYFEWSLDARRLTQVEPSVASDPACGRRRTRRFRDADLPDYVEAERASSMTGRSRSSGSASVTGRTRSARTPSSTLIWLGRPGRRGVADRRARGFHLRRFAVPLLSLDLGCWDAAGRAGPR
jgi:hypothetical protein